VDAVIGLRLAAGFSSWVRAEPASRLRNFHPHRPPAPPRPANATCGGRTPRETRKILPVDSLRQAWQEEAAMGESGKQFFFPVQRTILKGAPEAISYQFEGWRQLAGE